MRRFHTLHINTERTWRGGENQTLQLVVGLRDRDHGAELICQPDSPLERKAREHGVPVHPVAMHGELDPRAILKIRKILRGQDFDACQMHTSHAHALGVLARGRRSRPVTIVNRRVDFSIHRKGLFRLNLIKYRVGVDRYIAISHAIREVLVRDGVPAANVVVVHSGVNALAPPEKSRAAIREELGLAEKTPVIGNVAHLAGHKGQIYLVEAVAKLLPHYPDLHLVIVGEGDKRGEIEAAIARLGVGARCHLVGFQSDVAAYLRAIDFFVMPSTLEGLCTSILDALRAGLPVVASRTGGIPEIIRHEETGLLAEPRNPDSIAEGLGRLLRDRELARRLADQGRRLAEEEFSVDRMVTRTIEVYEDLIPEKKR